MRPHRAHIAHPSSPTLAVTDDKEGPNSVFQQNLKDAEVVITTPFHPGYLTRDLIEQVSTAARFNRITSLTWTSLFPLGEEPQALCHRGRGLRPH